MNTSNFIRSANKEGAVAISRGVPKWYKGRHYLKLAPSRELIQIEDKDEYTKRYKEEVLSKLEPEEVMKELGEGAILLCWEKPGEFCHRRIAAEWLEGHLGIVILELSPGAPKRTAKPETLYML